MIRKRIKQFFGLHDIEDLVIGGNCGCCGELMPNEIFEKNCSWGVCKECKGEE